MNSKITTYYKTKSPCHVCPFVVINTKISAPIFTLFTKGRNGDINVLYAFEI